MGRVTPVAKLMIKPFVIITIGSVLALAAAVMAVSTGMWGCGTLCVVSVIAFWLSLAIVVFGLWLQFWKSRKSGSS